MADALSTNADSFLADQARDKAAAIRNNFVAAANVPPDDFARATDISRETGIPWASLLASRDTMQRHSVLKDTNFSGLVLDHPLTADFLTDPDRAGVARDDTKSLTAMETAGNLLKTTIGAFGAAIHNINAGGWGLAQAATENVIEPVSGSFGSDIGSSLTAYVKRLRKLSEQDQATSQNFGGDVKDMGAIGRGYSNALMSAVQSMITLPAALEFQAAKGVTMLSSAVKGLLPLTLNQAGQSYAEARDANVGKAKALTYGAAQGATEMWTELLPMGRLIKDLNIGAPLWKTLRNQLVQENIGEQFATHFQDLNTWLTIHPERTVGQYLDERPNAALETLIATTLATGMHTTASHLAARSMEKDHAAQTAATQGAQSITDLFAAAAQSLTGKRSPNTLGQFLDHVAPDAAVLIDQNKLVEVLSQTGVDLRVLPSAEAQIKEGSLAGAGIEIPISELITGLTGTEAEKAIIPHLRLGADLPTLAEVEEHGAKAAEFFQKEADRVLEQESTNLEFQDAAKAVHDDLFTQLSAAARQGPQVNSTYAKLGTAFYTTLAHKFGVTPVQIRDGWTDAAGVEHRGFKLKIGNGENVPKNSIVIQNKFDQLNIGQDVPGGGTLTPAAIQAALEAIGVRVTEHQSHQSDSEMTSVIDTDRPLTADEAHELSVALGQEAIVQYHNGRGQLHGPSAAKWGEFNPEYYLTMTGDRLVDAALAQRHQSDLVGRANARQAEAYRSEVAWTQEGTENGFPVWQSANVALANPRDVTAGHDVFYMPLAGQKAVKYDILNPEGKVVGSTVLEIADGWPTMLLDIETKSSEQGKRYAEHTVAAIANDVGELAIWHIVPSARSWWERQGAAPVDEFNGSLTFDDYANARAGRENSQGLGSTIALHQTQSTRRPTTKRSPEDHLGEVALTVDYTKIEPEKTAQNMALVAKYPGLRFKARDPAKRAEEFIEHVTSNLLWLHDQIPAHIRNRSKLWYDGARRITERWAAKYDKSEAQVAAVLAVYSPQKDWFMNVSLAERTLDIVRDQQNTAWSPEMSKVASEILAKDKFDLLRASIEGKTLGELSDKLEQAAWLRVYDEAHNNRGHRLVTPEGGFTEYSRTVKGAEEKTGWPGFQTIVKALYIIEDGSPAMVDKALGGEHKVRSFYNNIFHPNSSSGFTTIDTHAVAAGLLRPLSGNSIEVTHNFGSGGAAQSATTGMSGTYPYYQEAYRRAAEARGLLPREMQSITWEAVRELYTMGFKHDQAKLTALDNLWTAYEKGKPIPDAEGAEAGQGADRESAGTADRPDRASSLAAVRRAILRLAGGVEQPAWFQGDSGISAQGWASTYTDELLGRGFSGAAGAAAGRAGSFASESAAAVLNQSGPVPQTQTPAFKAWFGDSKVVDEKGAPLRVFHSTTFGDFDTFDKASQRKGMAGYGFYFTDQLGAGIYSDYGLNFQADKDWQGNDKKVNVMPVYLRLRNPLVADDIEEVRARYGRRDPGQFGQDRQYGGMPAEALTAIQRDGYDGVIANEYVKRQRDGSYKVVQGGTKGAIKHPVYVVFEPTQIKSAIGNRGTFSPDDASVLNQSAPIIRAGAVPAPVIGVHFSREPRGVLNSSAFGSGLSGAERERLAQASDPRIKQRIAFYIDEGSGVHPEPGVGGAAHVAELTNLYDADADTLKIFRRNGRNLNAAESAVIDAGFDGYLQRKNFTNQGTAVLLGARGVEAEHVGGVAEANARATVPPPAIIPAMKSLALQLVNDRTLPGGALTAGQWANAIGRRDAVLSEQIDWAALDPETLYYKDELAATFWQQSETWYYSQLQRAIENASEKIFTTGAGVRQWLVANAGKLGVKKEELEYTGVTDWLDLQPKVSKQAVLDFMKAGGIKVEEVVLGGQPSEADTANALERWKEDARAGKRGEFSASEIDGMRASDILETLQEEYLPGFGSTKFEGYVLPGGENYRELLLTLPPRAAPKSVYQVIGAFPQDGFASRGEAQDYIDLMVETVKAPGMAPLQAQLDKFPLSINEYAADESKKDTFRSSHFDQPNILAHVRFNERTDTDGARVLFVEEVQSDWGQKGKKDGFANQEKTIDLDVALRRIEEGEKTALVYTNGPRAGMNVEIYDAEQLSSGSAYLEDYHRGEAVLKTLGVNVDGSTGVPSAPFVTDTKGWTALAVKRIVAYAAENGFDKVAWTTGAQQAARYDLSKQVSRIEVPMVNADGSRSVRIDPVDGPPIKLMLDTNGAVTGHGASSSQFTGKGLDEIIGKEIADRILSAKDPTTFSGDGLRVGGEGMRAYYDQILPQVVRDVLKKVGGGQIERVALSGTQTEAFASEAEADAWADANLDGHHYGVQSVREGFVVYDYDTQEFHRGSDSVTQQGFAVTDAMRAGVAKGVPLFQPKADEKLGSFSPTTLDLNLLANANYSTFVHELGHFFLTAYADLAAQPGAPQAIVDDMNAVLKQFGIADLATWNAMPLNEQRPYHEQIAESFEQYVFTGKAPSIELQPMFTTMMSWFKKVYESLRDFVATHRGAKLNPELAAVFDRMLATDAEIAAANAARGYMALFANAAEAGMSDKDFAAYKALDTAQREDAESMLRTRSLRDLKWMQARRDKIIAALQAEAKEKRAEVRKGVAVEVKATPIRQAERYLKRGVILSDNGTDIAPLGPHKLTIAEVRALFPEEALTPQPDWTKLGYGKYGMLVESGISPDEAATRFGLPSGGELVEQLLALKPLNQEIEELTDIRTLEQYGDLSSDSAITRAADEAIHNDYRTKAVATELSALTKAIGAPSILIKAAKEYARQIVETKTPKTLKAWSFAAAETRAGKAAIAALAKGDREQAAAEKRTELVNHVSAKEAYKAEKEIKKIVDRLRKLASYADDSSAVKSRDYATVQAVRALLGEHGIGNKGEAAWTYLDTVGEHDPGAAARLTDIIEATGDNPKNWQDVRISDLREFANAIDDIWYSAARVRQVEVQGKLLAEADVVAELYGTLEETGKLGVRVPGEGFAVTPTEELAIKFDAMKSVLKRMDAVAYGLDGQRAMGPWSRNIVGVVQDATAAMSLDKADKLGQYYRLLEAIQPQLGRRLIEARELTYTDAEGKQQFYVFGKGAGGSGRAELLHAILHTGNESNMRKLLLGRGWATLQPDGTMDTSRWDAFVARMHAEGHLTKADYDFVQGVWDLLESMKPLAQKAHRAVFGKFFSEVTARPIQTPFGTYRGGYVPATTDTRLVHKAAERKLAEQENDKMALAFPAPMKGFTNARVETYTRPLRLDLATLGSHINQVLLFSHMAVPINDVRRLISNPKVADALHRLSPGLITHTIIPWLNRASKNQISLTSPEFGGLGGFLRAGRSNAGTNTMLGNLSNAVQQITGILPATVDIKARYLRQALAHKLTQSTGVAEFVMSQSDYMKARIDNEASAMMHNVSEILINPSIYQSAVGWTKTHAFVLQSAVDGAISPTLWLASYLQARETQPGLSQRDCVHIADALIRQTQGSSGAADISTFEAGHPFFQLFTQFTGYFNMMSQFLHGRFVKNVAAEIGLPKKLARAFYIVAIGFYAQAVAAELISLLFKGGPDDDDKDGSLLDDWLWQLGIMAPVKMALAAVPFLGATVMAAGNAWNNKPYDDRISNSPAIAALEAGMKAGPDTYRAIFENGKPGKAIKDWGALLGLFTGLPTAALARPVSYLVDVSTGHTEPTSAADAIRGTLTGVASPDSKK